MSLVRERRVQKGDSVLIRHIGDTEWRPAVVIAATERSFMWSFGKATLSGTCCYDDPADMLRWKHAEAVG